MNNISFDNPFLLFLLLPLLAVVLVPFFITVKKDNANFHNVTSVILHIIICVCITLAFSGMSLETVVTETNVYVLADVSYSANNSLEEVQKKVNDVAGKLPKNSKMGVICFARDYKLVSDLDEKIPDVAEAAKELDRSATDIASALRYAGNLFDDDVIKRIIVITDGAETVTSTSIIKVVNNLQENGVYVDAVYLDDNITPDVREVQLDGVDATASTFLNKVEQASVIVRASCGVDGDGKAVERTEGYLTLTRDGEQIEKKPVTLYNGLNVINMDLPTDKAGSFAYGVKVETVNASDDGSQENNSYAFTQKISDDRKVLFIGGSERDLVAGQRVYGEEGVEYISEIKEIPFSVEELCVYDEIALCNFDVRKMSANQAFLSSLATLVDEYGKTLTTFGNTFIQENIDGTDAALNALADLLPVKVGNADKDARLVAIMLDISRSEDYSSRLEVAKRAAVSLLSILNSNDMVMVVAFSGEVKLLLPPTKLTSVSAIIDTINNISVENETDMFEALDFTYKQMFTKPYDRYRDKQIFIISDGYDRSGQTQTTIIDKAKQISADGVAISALGIYPLAGYGDFLDKIVNNENAVSGSFYKEIVNEQSVDFTLKEIIDETQQIEIFGDAYDVTIRSMEQVVEGLTDLGSINGFYYNSAKSTASAVITAKYWPYGNVPGRLNYDVPVYAYWSGGGNGKVVSFMSDIASDWTGAWSEGSEGAKFLSNIPQATLPEERITSPFIIKTECDGSTATVYVNAASALNSGAQFKVTLIDPEGVTTEKNLAFNSGFYVANFQTPVTGLYAVHVEYTFGDVNYSADSSFSVAYYAEYDAFASFNKSSLYRLITEYGSILDLEDTERLENSNSAYTSYIFDFTLSLMVVCAVLFVIDVIIRQLKWKDITTLFGGLFRRRKK